MHENLSLKVAIIDFKRNTWEDSKVLVDAAIKMVNITKNVVFMTNTDSEFVTAVLARISPETDFFILPYATPVEDKVKELVDKNDIIVLVDSDTLDPDDLATCAILYADEIGKVDKVVKLSTLSSIIENDLVPTLFPAPDATEENTILEESKYQGMKPTALGDIFVSFIDPATGTKTLISGVFGNAVIKRLKNNHGDPTVDNILLETQMEIHLVVNQMIQGVEDHDKKVAVYISPEEPTAETELTPEFIENMRLEAKSMGYSPEEFDAFMEDIYASIKTKNEPIEPMNSHEIIEQTVIEEGKKYGISKAEIDRLLLGIKAIGSDCMSKEDVQAMCKVLSKGEGL